MPARKSAQEQRRARIFMQESAPQDATLEGLAEEIIGLTISDGGSDTTSRMSKLWTSRQQFQEMRPPPERITSASLNAAIAETFRLATTSATTSSPSFSSPPVTSDVQFSRPSTPPPVQAPSSRIVPRPECQRSQLSTTLGIVRDEVQPQLATIRSVPPSNPSLSVETLTHRHQLLPSPSESVSNGVPTPPRFPRSTAMQRAVEKDLRMATSIGLDLNSCEEMVIMEPTIDLYHQLRRQLDLAEKSIRLLRDRDVCVQQARNNLLSQHSHLSEVLVAWHGMLDLPDKPRTVDTSELFIIL